MSAILAASPYQRIKQQLRERLVRGEWAVGARLPSETELVARLGVARMTVHRAVRELAAEGLLLRVQGVGTFVAPPQNRSELLEVRDIAADITARGHRHRARIVERAALRAPADTASLFDLRAGAKLYHSVLVHYEDEVPVQLEERQVVPGFAPDYLSQDFTRITPGHYLLGIAPPDEVDHVVFAVLADKRAQKLLRIGPTEPCLVLTRRTWVRGAPVTRSVLTHPGSRYSLGSRRRTR